MEYLIFLPLLPMIIVPAVAYFTGPSEAEDEREWRAELEYRAQEYIAQRIERRRGCQFRCA